MIVDTSGSMGFPRAKLRAAQQATAAAIDCIRDEVAFGVIGGTQEAYPIYPKSGALVPASAATRAEAKDAVGRLKARGGTAIGTWLALANTLFATAPPRDPAHRRPEQARDPQGARSRPGGLRGQLPV